MPPGGRGPGCPDVAQASQISIEPRRAIPGMNRIWNGGHTIKSYEMHWGKGKKSSNTLLSYNDEHRERERGRERERERESKSVHEDESKSSSVPRSFLHRMLVQRR